MCGSAVFPNKNQDTETTQTPRQWHLYRRIERIQYPSPRICILLGPGPVWRVYPPHMQAQLEQARRKCHVLFSRPRPPHTPGSRLSLPRVRPGMYVLYLSAPDPSPVSQCSLERVLTCSAQTRGLTSPPFLSRAAVRTNFRVLRCVRLNSKRVPRLLLCLR